MKAGSSSARTGTSEASTTTARAAAAATNFLRRLPGFMFMLTPASVAAKCGDTEEDWTNPNRWCGVRHFFSPRPATAGRRENREPLPSPPPRLRWTGHHRRLLRRVPALGQLRLGLGRWIDLVDRMLAACGRLRHLLGRHLFG